MNKDDFEAMQATLQAQLDAADRLVTQAQLELEDAERSCKAARIALRGHITYGKHRGWIARDKRAKKEPVAA